MSSRCSVSMSITSSSSSSAAASGLTGFACLGPVSFVMVCGMSSSSIPSTPFARRGAASSVVVICGQRYSENTGLKKVSDKREQNRDMPSQIPTPSATQKKVCSQSKMADFLCTKGKSHRVCYFCSQYTRTG